MKIVLFLILPMAIMMAKARVMQIIQVDYANDERVPEVASQPVDCQKSIKMEGSLSCMHGQCDALCKLAGYHHGVCSSPTTCTCY